MKWINLDMIVTGLLLEKRYPIQYYIQFLYLASRGYQTIHFSSLANTKTLKLPVNSYNAIELPCDFLDWVKVGVAHGQLVQALSERRGITRLNNFDDSGNKITFGKDNLNGVEESAMDATFFRGYQQFYNENGEFTGRMFGVANGENAQTFRLAPERNEIQLHEGLRVKDIILQYTTDGSSIDNATMITPYARAVIEAYIIWKMKEANRSIGLGERAEAKRQYGLELALFRAQMFPLTRQGIYATVRKNTHGSIKG